MTNQPKNDSPAKLDAPGEGMELPSEPGALKTWAEMAADKDRLGKRNRHLRQELEQVREENKNLRLRLLSAAGDDLCRLSQEEIKDYTSGKVQIPPKEEFLPSCERFHEQISNEAGVLKGCLTLAQLIAENEKLTSDLQQVRESLANLRRLYDDANDHLCRQMDTNARLEKGLNEAKDSQDEIVNINSRHIHFLTDKLITATARIAELEAEVVMWKPMTPEEAEAAIAEAESIPISDEAIERIVAKVTDPTYRPSEPEHVLMAAKIKQLQSQLAERPKVECSAIDFNTPK